MAQRIKVKSVAAPEWVYPGTEVECVITIENITHEYVHTALTGMLEFLDLDGQDFSFQLPEEGNWTLAPFQSITQKIYFEMKSSNTVVHVWSWYWDEHQYAWVDDDWNYALIMEEAPPYEPPIEQRATIVGKRLYFLGTKEEKDIPVSDVLQGTRIRVQVDVRNEMDSWEKLGATVKITGPDGETVFPEEGHYETLDTAPGGIHYFTIPGPEWPLWPYVELEKPGTYQTRIRAFMKRWEPDIMDEYVGELCTVAEAPPEPPPDAEFKDMKITDYTRTGG